MTDVLVDVGHHGPAPIPAPLSHYVYLRGQESIGRPNHGADVAVVVPVLDGDVEWMSAGVEVGHDGLHPPVAVTVDHVTAVAATEQFLVEVVSGGPGFGVGTDADGTGHRLNLPLLILSLVKYRFGGGGRRSNRVLPRDPWGRFRVGLAGFAAVIVMGTGGYLVLGLGLLDAVYQTVVTVSTVGYREIGEVGDRYQIFTVLLILFGTGTALYTLSVLLETLFEGRLNDQFRRRRMQNEIDRLRGHVVLCGYGQVGRAILAELDRAERDVVIIDRVELDPELRFVVTGEATEDEVLTRAGLDRAATLVLALNFDVDNLYVTLTARSLRSDLYIVARANSSAVGPKLHRAGADRVVNPHEIGGSHMAQLVLEP